MIIGLYNFFLNKVYKELWNKSRELNTNLKHKDKRENQI